MSKLDSSPIISKYNNSKVKQLELEKHNLKSQLNNMRKKL